MRVSQWTVAMSVHVRPDGVRACPYCGAMMLWIPLRWFGRGTFVCRRCGEFPDLRLPAETLADVSAPAEYPPPVPRGADERPRVLMIDDSITERDLYALLLERDVRILTAARGPEGLALAEKEQPDAIVLDVMMPEMNGWEVCRRLKSNPHTSGIPVIILTGQDDPNLSREATRLGAATLLYKPCPIERLASVLTGAIAASHDCTEPRPPSPD
jgi:CheY-like chemotaxis protein